MHYRTRLGLDQLDERAVPAYGLDPTFGNAGTTLLGSDVADVAFIATSSVALGDGSLLIAGSFAPTVNDFPKPAVLKLKADGSVDTSFNGGAPATIDDAQLADQQSVKMAVQADGKIVLATTLMTVSGADIAVYRLNADGTPDGQFALLGSRVLALDLGGTKADILADLKILNDGRIAVLGNSATGADALSGQRDITLTVLTKNGAIDTSFAGGSGTARVNLGGTQDSFDTASALAIQEDGSFIVAADRYATTASESNAPYIVKLTSQGLLDTSVNKLGIQPIDFSSQPGFEVKIVDVSVNENGDVVVLGKEFAANTAGIPGFAVPSEYIVTRLQANGTMDTVFGTDGVTRVQFKDANQIPVTESTPSSLKVLDDGSIVVVGSARTQEIHSGDIFAVNDFAVARLTTAGQLDSTFGTNGQVLVRFDPATNAGSTGGTNDVVRSSVVRPDGTIVLVGNSSVPLGDGSTALAVAQLAPLSTSPPPASPPATSPPPASPPATSPPPASPPATSPPPASPPATSPPPASPPATSPPPASPPATSPPPAGGKTVQQPVWAPTPGQRIFPEIPSSVVRFANGDFNADGVEDYVFYTASGDSLARVIDGKTGNPLTGEWRPYEARFKGGLNVATGDITGDGRPEIIFSPNTGGSARIQIFSMDSGSPQVRANFFGIGDPNYRGGATITVGDFTGDGKGDLAVGAGLGGGPRVAVWNGAKVLNSGAMNLVNEFFALSDTSFRGGVNLAAGDFDNDGKADLAVGTGAGGAPRVRVFKGGSIVAGTPEEGVLSDFFVRGDVNSRNGISLTSRINSKDGKAELVTFDRFGERVYVGAQGDGVDVTVERSGQVLSGPPRARLFGV